MGVHRHYQGSSAGDTLPDEHLFGEHDIKDTISGSHPGLVVVLPKTFTLLHAIEEAAPKVGSRDKRSASDLQEVVAAIRSVFEQELLDLPADMLPSVRRQVIDLIRRHEGGGKDVVIDLANGFIQRIDDGNDAQGPGRESFKHYRFSASQMKSFLGALGLQEVADARNLWVDPSGEMSGDFALADSDYFWLRNELRTLAQLGLSPKRIRNACKRCEL